MEFFYIFMHDWLDTSGKVNDAAESTNPTFPCYKTDETPICVLLLSLSYLLQSFVLLQHKICKCLIL